MKTRNYLTMCLGIIALALTFNAACGGDDGPAGPEVDCATAVVPTFANVNAFATCVGCHSSALSGTERLGAPAGVDYDNYDAAMANAAIGVDEVYAGTMPPVGALSPQDTQDFYAWALCGTPQ